MGGAAGHMAHPFDCREVRNGRDLINFYVKAVNAIPLYEEESKGSSVSVKLDGVNTSFRLQKANNPAGFMFVIDRGGKTPGARTKYDFEGVTPDNVVKRFGGNKDHGMVQVVNHMSKILNHNLMELRPYVEALGLFERMGPEGVFFDAEYYANGNEETGYNPVKNNVNYGQNYIAIHRLSEFYTETKESKTGKTTSRRLTRGFYWETVGEINDLLKQKDQLLAQRQNTAEIDQLIAAKNKELKAKKQEHQEVLDDLAKAIQKHATELDMPFNIYTKIGVRFKEGLTREIVLRRIEEALNMRVSYNYKKVNEQMSVGPVRINEQTGELEGRTLKELLLSVKENPAHVAYYPDTPGFTKDGESVKGKIRTKDDYIKDPKQSAFALKMYEDIMVTGHKTGVGPFDIGASPRDAEAINSAVILWHAVRHIGNALKKSVMTDVDLDVEGGDDNHEGIVIQSTDICDGIAFKFTGEFIVDNRAAGFGVSPKGEEVPSNSAEALHENKFKYGELLESYAIEAGPVTEEKRKTVILIPGGFKPPTGGHYSMIKQYESKPDVVKVLVITGPKAREGVTLQQSRAIFDIYGGFSDKVEFMSSNDPTPLKTCYELMENDEFVSQFGDVEFSIGASNKGGDPKRIQGFVSYFAQRPELSKANISAYAPAEAHDVAGAPASASRMRKAFRDGDWETFKKLLPDDNFYDDVVQVLNKQTNSQEVVAEGFFTMNYLFSLVEQAEKEEFTNPEDIIKSKAVDIVLDPKIVGANISDNDLESMISRLSLDIQKKLKVLINQYQKSDEEIKDRAMAVSEQSSVAGGSMAFSPGSNKMEDTLQEKQLRKIIRQAIRIREINKKQNLIDTKLQENKLRKVVRHIITEADIDADTKPAPYSSTPINMLADALSQILPIIKSGLRKLSKPEERQSYRAHVLSKMKSTFGGFESLDARSLGALGEGDLTEQESDNKISIELDDPDRVMPSDGKEDARFQKADMSPEDQLESDFEDFKEEGLDPTGARVAFETINDSNIESVLADKRKALAQNPEYVEQFKNYTLYNIDLWLASFEEDLARTLGQQPAFTGVSTEKPSGAQVAGSAEKFASEMPMSAKRDDNLIGEEDIEVGNNEPAEEQDDEDTTTIDLSADDTAKQMYDMFV